MSLRPCSQNALLFRVEEVFGVISFGPFDRLVRKTPGRLTVQPQPFRTFTESRSFNCRRGLHDYTAGEKKKKDFQSWKKRAISRTRRICWTASSLSFKLGQRSAQNYSFHMLDGPARSVTTVRPHCNSRQSCKEVRKKVTTGGFIAARFSPFFVFVCALCFVTNARTAPTTCISVLGMNQEAFCLSNVPAETSPIGFGWALMISALSLQTSVPSSISVRRS